jgi:hypothetical protein
MILFCVGVMYCHVLCWCHVTLSQWHNVISGAPRFKIFEGLASISAKGTSRPPYMHEFFRGSRAGSPGKFLNRESLKCHFPDFGEIFYRILMVRKRHCNIWNLGILESYHITAEYVIIKILLYLCNILFCMR